MRRFIKTESQKANDSHGNVHHLGDDLFGWNGWSSSGDRIHHLPRPVCVSVMTRNYMSSNHHDWSWLVSLILKFIRCGRDHHPNDPLGGDAVSLQPHYEIRVIIVHCFPWKFDVS